MDRAKENWIEHYIFFAGSKWDDPRPTREEAERAWAERHGTPEAPEWKGETRLIGVVDVDGTTIPIEQTKLERIGTGSYRLTIMRAETSGTATVTVGTPAPLDLSGCTQQAMDDFVAKREKDIERDTALTCDLLSSMYARPEDPNLSRALSTPLPHDPDIHTRLMPWRGKE